MSKIILMFLFLKKNKLLVTILFTLFISKCDLSYFQDSDSINDAYINAPLSFPVGKNEYYIRDLVESISGSVTIITSPENIPTIIYADTLSAERAEEFLNLDNQIFQETLVPPITNNLSGTIPITIIQNENLNFDLDLSNNKRIDSLNIKSGEIILNINSTFNFRVNFDLIIPSLMDPSGNVLSISGTFHAPDNPNFTRTQNLANFKGHFFSTNTITGGNLQAHINYQIVIDAMSEIRNGDRIDLTMRLENLKFNSFFGNVGTKSLRIKNFIFSADNFLASFGANINGINFGDPSIKLILNNSFGFPIGIDFQNIISQNSSTTGESINLQGEITNNVSVINAPRVNQYGHSITSEIILNNQNSNISELINSKNDFFISLLAMPNPETALAQYNFVDEESELNILIERNIPFDMSINNLTITDTINFTNGQDIEGLKNLKLLLFSKNSMPVSGQIGVNFLDSLNNLTLSIDSMTVFSAPNIGANGKVTNSANKTSEYLFTKEEIKYIQKSTNIEAFFTIKTPNAENNQTIKFFNDSKIELRLAIEGEIERTPEL